MQEYPSEKTNGGKYENFCHRQTDGQTDGADYIGPEAGPTSKLEVDPLRRKEKKSRTN